MPTPPESAGPNRGVSKETALQARKTQGLKKIAPKQVHEAPFPRSPKKRKAHCFGW